MAINDLYRVTLIQTYDLDGPECRNVFYYKQITPGGVSEGADALLAAFQTGLYPDIDAIQNVVINTREIRVENIVAGFDNAVATFGVGTEVGQRGGECLPPYAAWAFKLHRLSTAVRNGQKRFAGVSESDQVNGIATGTIIPLLNACASSLDKILGGPVPDTATYQPRIFRAAREEDTIPAKIIPALLQADFDIADASFTGVSTQNSRKFNAGA